MDLRDLKYFETIAELEHVGKATKKLHRTQPALTSCIRRLEESCGVPLFERSGRGIKLTTAGSILLRWARRIRLDAEEAQREIKDVGRGLTGHVRVGIVPTAAQFLLPPAVRQLMEQAPRVTLKTVVGLVDTLKPMLLSGELDLMVGTEGATEAGLASLTLAEDTIVVAACSTHGLAKLKPRLKDLCAYSWVLQPPGAPTRDWLDQTFVRKNLPRPVVQIESSMLLMLPHLIAETGLLSFISRQHLSKDGTHGKLVEIPVKDAMMRRKLVVTHRTNSYLSAAALLLIKLLTQSAESAGPLPRKGEAVSPC